MRKAHLIRLICVTLVCIGPFYLQAAGDIDTLNPVINSILRKQSALTGQKQSASPEYIKDTALIGEYISKSRSFQGENYDSLLFYARKSLASSLKIQDPGLISRSLQLLGRHFNYLEDFKNSGKCFLICLKIEESLHDQDRIADINDELGTVYYNQEVFEKSLQYYNTALEVYLRKKDSLNIAKVYSHIGNLHSSREFCETRNKQQKQHDFDLAIQFLEKSIAICRKINYKPLLINGYVNVASVYNKLDQPLKALPYLTKAIDYYRSEHNLNRISSTLFTLGKTYFKLHQYDRSMQAFRESEDISLANKFTDGIQYLYEAMAQTADADKDYKSAYNYYIKYMTIRDSLNNAQKSKALFELETRYQTEKKEKEILKLTIEKKEKNRLLYFLAALILILLVLGYFIIKNFRNRRTIAEQTLKIQEQHILELEKERQLIATKSVLQGEEAERSRMARDLHDGLGGMLSSVKINLSSMKGNSILSDENADAFNHALNLLDHSITELRRVAHNMMPETLVHYGLKAAFQDFITRIRTDQTPAIEFQFYGQEGRYSAEMEITIYRIGQELVNNALKHARASQITLQFISEPARLCLEVSDDGQGYDSSRKASGKGLESIRDRVSANNGRFEIWSKPGEGTEATVEFLLP